MKNFTLIIIAFAALTLTSCVSGKKYSSSKQTWEERYTRLNADNEDLQAWKTSWEARYKALDANNGKLRVENMRLETALKAANVVVAPLSMAGEKINTEVASAVAVTEVKDDAALTVAVQK